MRASYIPGMERVELTEDERAEVVQALRAAIDGIAMSSRHGSSGSRHSGQARSGSREADRHTVSATAASAAPSFLYAKLKGSRRRR
jgi:hypothetical protein